VEIRTRIGTLGSTSLEFLTEIRRNDGRELAASGRVVVVLWDWARHSKMQISDALRRKVTECSTAGS
jgi:acyl-CoA thioesterase FadM